MRVTRWGLGWSCLALLACASLAGARGAHEYVGSEGPAFMRRQLRTAPGRQAAQPTADANITQSPGDDVDPQISPDGTQVLFATNRNGDYDIVVCRMDGSNPDTGAANSPKLLSGAAGDERYPAWSPGGAEIAYVRGNAIYLRNLHTSLEVLLIDQLPGCAHLCYSPDGTRIVFSARLAGDADLNLYWVTTDTRAIDPATGKPQMVQITNAAGNEVSPQWFPNNDVADSRQLIFASDALGDYDIFRVTVPSPGDPPAAVVAANRVIGTGGDGNQTDPCWVKAGGQTDPNYDLPFYILYADDAAGNYDVKVADADGLPTNQIVYQGPGDQRQPFGSPLQDTTHNQAVYSGKKPGAGANYELYVIDIFDNSPPILGDGFQTYVPTVTPQRAFPGSNITVTTHIFDRGSGVEGRPTDYNGDGLMDSGVWAVLSVPDLPVYARWAHAGSTIVNSNHWIPALQQIEYGCLLVDWPGSVAGGTLVTADPSDPNELGASPGPNGYAFGHDEAVAFVQRIGVPMYDDGTNGDAVAGDGIFTARFTAPAEAHDYYIDIVPMDKRGNLPWDTDLGVALSNRTNPLSISYDKQDQAPAGITPAMGFWCIGYDHVAGFSTRQIDITRRVLMVSDYGGGQKYQAADFASTDSAPLTRYWPVALPTEHYWFSGDDDTGNESGIGDIRFVTNGNPNPPTPIAQVERYRGARPPQAFPGGAAGSIIPAIATGIRLSLTELYEYQGAGAQRNESQFGGPDQEDRAAVWRILCRGPLDPGTLNAYTPSALPAVEGSPVPSQDGERMVIWASPYCGDVFAQPGTLIDASTQSLLRGFLGSGGRLLVSGPDIAWALTKNGTQASPFLQQVLHGGFVSDASAPAIQASIFAFGNPTFADRSVLTAVDTQAGVEPQLFQFTGSPIHHSMTDRWGFFQAGPPVPDTLEPLRLNASQGGFGDDGCPNSWFLDDITAANGGALSYNYAVGGAGAMVRYLDPATGGRVVYTSFGIEAVRDDYQLRNVNNTFYITGMGHRMRLLTNIGDYLCTGGLLGKVVGPDGFTPQAGVQVIARRGTTTTGTILGRTTTLSDGTYLLKGLTVGDYSVFVVSAEFTADHRPTQRVYGGQTSKSSDLSIRLLKFDNAAVFGTVTDANNKPVAGATITAVLATAGTNPLTVTATTDTNGQYSLTLPTGTYNITASAAGFASTTLANIAVLAGQDQQKDIVLQAAPGTLKGKVTGSGSPVANASVAATKAGVTIATATTDAAGGYTLSLVAGSYDVIVTAAGFQQKTQVGVAVTSNTTATQDFDLSPVPPGSITGLVTAQGSSTPVGGVTITLLVGTTAVRTTTTAATLTTQGGTTYNWILDNVPAGTYDVQAAATGYAPQTLTSITVTSNQATNGVNFVLQPLHVFISGVTMVSAPFDYATAAPDIQKLIDDDPATTLRLATYDTPNQKYVYYPTAPANTFRLGRGYFMKLDKNVPLTREGVRASTTGQGYDIPLTAGWNLIGSVYEFPVDLFGCQVVFANTTYTLQDAVNRGLVAGTLYTLNFNAYQQVYRMDPWTGYWLRSYQNCTLRIPPVPLGGTPRAVETRAAATATQWKATIAASTAKGLKATASFGVGTAAADVYDPADRAQPPRPPLDGWLELSFPHGDWGRFAGAYGTDVRAPQRQLRWVLEVSCDQPGELVTLSWPDLGARLPAGVSATLEDLQTGKRCSMRQAAGFTVTSTGGSRQVAITVQPADQHAAITGLGYSTSRGGIGGEVRFVLAAPMHATAIVRGLAGRLVRTLVTDKAFEAGPQSVVWDGHDEAGHVVPDGTYRIEVIGISELGEQVRATATVLQHR